MATPFFGKRENEVPTGVRPVTASGSPGGGTAVTPSTAPQPVTSQNAVRPASSEPAAAPRDSGSKLTVGPNIKLKGVEITDCDTLLVEGMVEATMNSRVMQIAEQGAFKGTAEVDIAEIRGQFDGNLTVRQKVVIYATGKVSGTIRYGKLVVEEGAQLSGEIAYGAQAAPAKPAPIINKPGLQPATA